jgi:hypothetical protein
MIDGPDLRFLGRQIGGLVTDVASLRDDMRVLTAITMRIDNQLARLMKRAAAVSSSSW